MRVTSALWVSAFVRRCNGAAAMAVVARRGAEEAGAIFVIVDKLDGTEDLYGPAPQSAFEDDRPADRKFQLLLGGESPATIAARMERELKFDPDLWVVGVEDRAGRVPLDLV